MILDHRVLGTFGNILPQTGASIDFDHFQSGMFWDADSQLYYARVRWYDPTSGGFFGEGALGFAGVPSQRLEEPTKKSHGRSDSRIYLQFEVPNPFTGTSRWKNLRTIGVAVYTSIVRGQQKIDIRNFISSLAPDIQQLARAVRKHWGI